MRSRLFPPVFVAAVLAMGFLAYNLYNAPFMKNLGLWVLGVLVIYWFSVSGGMHNIIRGVPMYYPDQSGQVKVHALSFSAFKEDWTDSVQRDPSSPEHLCEHSSALLQGSVASHAPATLAFLCLLMIYNVGFPCAGIHAIKSRAAWGGGLHHGVNVSLLWALNCSLDLCCSKAGKRVEPPLCSLCLHILGGHALSADCVSLHMEDRQASLSAHLRRNNLISQLMLVCESVA